VRSRRVSDRIQPEGDGDHVRAICLVGPETDSCYGGFGCSPFGRRRDHDDAVLPGHGLVGAQVSAAHTLGRWGRASAATCPCVGEPAVALAVTIPRSVRTRSTDIRGHSHHAIIRYILGSTRCQRLVMSAYSGAWENPGRGAALCNLC